MYSVLYGVHTEYTPAYVHVLYSGTEYSVLTTTSILHSPCGVYIYVCTAYYPVKLSSVVNPVRTDYTEYILYMLCAW